MRFIADVRALCAELTGSQETFPFGAATLVFKVGGKMYALTDLQGDPVALSVKVRPEYGEELRAAHGAITPGHHLNKRHWVTLRLDGTLPKGLATELLRESHTLVVKGLTKAQRAALGVE
ncbi:MmcQ/YjbR family DNA-binding protein [Deinococcus hopiensis]|uniref:Predicted DNA-binding protein, MmcQ/YjbR family n=1 Tax=Deinococcus hopiensis KR-140 TaxID=695939 RepID=A0A1W1VRV7_9DEIO|nr:MmcQ/YjbR family DNA-binding protein [Deinococcus hopiensis]SMB96112.1 Predicted DNA-binding protein, MmcQ/YjbR family [Deinococcus hopiensis KR-140]